MLSFELVALTPFSYPDDIKRTSLVRQAGTPIKTPPTRTLARNALLADYAGKSLPAMNLNFAGFLPRHACHETSRAPSPKLH